VTLAHELGHAYHNHIIHDEPALAQQKGTSVAETASTFMENLVLDAVIEQTTDENERLAIEKRLKDDPKAITPRIIDKQKEFAQLRASDDGRYVAIHNRLVVTTPAEGRRIQQLWTTREFKSDFVLKLEFRATPNADSGIFLKGKQLQCRDYPLAGPYKELKNYKPQQWNEVEITVKGNVARCLCNGEVLEEAFPIPATGPIGLEGDRGQMEYRNLRIKLSE
jgi:hypothetical protein